MNTEITLKTQEILLKRLIKTPSLLSAEQRQEWRWHRGTEESLVHRACWAPPGQTIPRSRGQESGPLPNVCVSAATRGAWDKDIWATMQGLSSFSGEFQNTWITYQSCDIMQHLDLRQKEQISLEMEEQERGKKGKIFFLQAIDTFQGLKLTLLHLQNSQRSWLYIHV